MESFIIVSKITQLSHYAGLLWFYTGSLPNLATFLTIILEQFNQ